MRADGRPANWSISASRKRTPPVGKRLPASMARRTVSTECSGVAARAADQNLFAHDKGAAARWASVTCASFLLQVGPPRPTIFVAQHVEAAYAPRARAGFRRASFRQPGCSAKIQARQARVGRANRCTPGPAVRAGEYLLDGLVGHQGAGAVRLEVIDPDDAGFRCGHPRNRYGRRRGLRVFSAWRPRAGVARSWGCPS